MTLPIRPRPREPQTKPPRPSRREQAVRDIDRSLAVLSHAQQHHVDPRAEERIDELLAQRWRLTQEDT